MKEFSASISGTPSLIQTDLGLEKYCKGCNEYYPADLEFFFLAKINKDGSSRLETLCKACRMERKRGGGV